MHVGLLEDRRAEDGFSVAVAVRDDLVIVGAVVCVQEPLTLEGLQRQPDALGDGFGVADQLQASAVVQYQVLRLLVNSV